MAGQGRPKRTSFEIVAQQLPHAGSRAEALQAGGGGGTATRSGAGRILRAMPRPLDDSYGGSGGGAPSGGGPEISDEDIPF